MVKNGGVYRDVCHLASRRRQRSHFNAIVLVAVMIDPVVVGFVVVTGVVITAGGVFGGFAKFRQQFVVVPERRNVQKEQLFLVLQLALEISGHIVVAQVVARMLTSVGSTTSKRRYVT
uniref:(northern house mosquito) hypothetical protein n=1 Tax=Culex pipiens TaxID=7175 RepID=A0A8D8G5G1_CULPI